MEQLITYDNTPSNASAVGWQYLVDHCVGDLNASKVTHDHVKGVFVFHDENPSINVLLEAFRL